MDGAADAVGQLSVEFGKLVAAVNAGVGDVPHGGGLHNVPDHELLDGLVLGAGLGAVGAADELNMAAAVLVAASVPPFRGHFNFRQKFLKKIRDHQGFQRGPYLGKKWL